MPIMLTVWNLAEFRVLKPLQRSRIIRENNFVLPFHSIYPEKTFPPRLHMWVKCMYSIIYMLRQYQAFSLPKKGADGCRICQIVGKSHKKRKENHFPNLQQLQLHTKKENLLWKKFTNNHALRSTASIASILAIANFRFGVWEVKMNVNLHLAYALTCKSKYHFFIHT